MGKAKPDPTHGVAFDTKFEITKSSDFPFLNRLERSVIIENGKNIY